ncbi:hypothetical protein [Labilibaculum antarcticum]|uniref:Uncharacterized protein n=1 Tax=Labilibaculum antarcticum TaxID=1717717 RepID=A0A1Y1CN20_9BACT|nr:hypothetical protein [Labilibaculum antarcticum]BAX81818.1 hypothetical protein ALGA_3520 [Labilibaculum antarcticum]
MEIELRFLFGPLLILTVTLIQGNKIIVVKLILGRFSDQQSKAHVACAYNLKKLLKFARKKTKIMVNQAITCFSIVMNQFGSFNSFLRLQ